MTPCATNLVADLVLFWRPLIQSKIMYLHSCITSGETVIADDDTDANDNDTKDIVVEDDNTDDDDERLIFNSMGVSRDLLGDSKVLMLL